MGRMKESIMTEPEFSETQEQHTWHRGMTLRDYFAAKAMQGLICEFLEDFKRTKTKKEKDILKKEFAGACYGVADEMLKARK